MTIRPSRLTLLPAACFALLAAPAHATPPRPAIFDELNATLEPLVPLEEGWENPPRIARTRNYWWWLNSNTDKPTITRELEAMKAIGMGGALIFDAGGDNQRGNRRLPAGPTFGSPEWIDMFRHACAEADRLGLELSFNIQSGWNLGGPNVLPEHSSKKITYSHTRIEGGQAIDIELPQPQVNRGYYSDSRVVAVPLPESDEVTVASARASSAQPDMDAARAGDGDPATYWVSNDGPTPENPQWIELTLSAPATADSIAIHPRTGYGPRNGSIEAVTADGRTELATFTDGGDAPIIVTFPATRIETLRVTTTVANDARRAAARNVQIAAILLYEGESLVAPPPARPTGGVNNLAQKAYFQYPGRFTAAPTWHLLDHGPEQPGERPVAPATVVDLTGKTDADGRLRWEAPPGQWEILRFGSTLSGAHVSTHSEGAGGHAIDYLDRAALDAYWESTLDPIFDAVRPYLGRSLRFLHTDSWELGPVNWTRLMPEEFQRLRGYDITPWLPVLGGHLVESREASNRFLNDFRRTLADLMAEKKYEGFSERARALGMGIHPQCGGPHAGPMDALRNHGISDIVNGEFWSTSPQHRVRDDQRFFVKQTSSGANTYGRRVVFSEAFTNIGRHWQHHPRSLKPTFDRAACEGHNLTYWHTFPSSKEEHGLPGAAYFAGEHLNPNVTWWEQGRAFIEFLNRCHFLIQQGVSNADVLHFYGENVPSFVRLQRDDPAQSLPGYDYDVINAHALLHRVTADDDGHAVLPEGTRYRIVSLVGHDAVGLPVLRHLAALVENGVTLVGPAPQRAFSLTGGSQAETEFFDLVARLWDDTPAGEKRVGKGRVIWGKTTRDVLQTDGLPEAFTWTGGDAGTYIDFTQRRTDAARIYYVANRHNRPEDVTLRFRGTGHIPEIWDPVSGSRREASEFRFADGVTELPYPMEPHESFFVIFRKPAESGRADGPNVPALAALADITGPWQVAFDPAWGGPESITFDSLIDWTTHADDGIRHYSGAATYRKRFDAPAHDGKVYLDLGMVESLCEVRLNGTDLGVWWSFPYRRDITEHLRPGTNELEVKVINLWANRIIGDAALPPEQRLTSTNITNLAANTPLSPAGLIGPVRLMRVEPPE